MNPVVCRKRKARWKERNDWEKEARRKKIIRNSTNDRLLKNLFDAFAIVDIKSTNIVPGNLIICSIFYVRDV